MNRPLPRLRMNLDFMPSPVPDRPGLFVRDPFRYTDATAIIPPGLIDCLQYFDGQHTTADLAAHLRELTGEADVGEPLEHLVKSLSEYGYLEDATYATLRAQRHDEFARAAERLPAHAGGGYPDDLEELGQTLSAYMTDATDAPMVTPLPGRLRALAAPHVSPFGGWRSYQAAYRPLMDGGGGGGAASGLVDLSGAPLRSARSESADRTVIVLGTSHYGAPQRFGLTRKPYVTPYGATRTAGDLVDRLERAAPEAVVMEDYCHSVEHSVEFQVIFLQHLLGPGVRVVPILCGSYLDSILEGGSPEQDEGVARFLGALGELAAADPDLLWVLGVDMAHMGRRYGDDFAALAAEDEMAEVVARDRARIERLAAGDAAGFWDLVQENHDDLKWCGAAPFYTLLKALPDLRGQLLSYEQWNIDEQSVVSFAGMGFRQGGDIK